MRDASGWKGDILQVDLLSIDEKGDLYLGRKAVVDEAGERCRPSSWRLNSADGVGRDQPRG
jgi:hypothetical protein